MDHEWQRVIYQIWNCLVKWPKIKEIKIKQKNKSEQQSEIQVQMDQKHVRRLFNSPVVP